MSKTEHELNTRDAKRDIGAELLASVREMKAALEERLKELEAYPEAGYSWKQVKSHLRNATWRSA